MKLQDHPGSKLVPIIRGLRSGDRAERETARAMLHDLDTQDAPTIRIAIQESLRAFPDDDSMWDRGSVVLMAWVSRRMQPELVQPVLQSYLGLDSATKYYALTALVCANSEEGIQAALDLYEVASEEVSETGFPFRSLEYSLLASELVFPRLLQIDKQAGAANGVHLLLAYCTAGKVSATQREACLHHLLPFAERRRKELNQFKDQSGGRARWYWDEPAAFLRSELAVCLDVLGYFDDESSRQMLELCTDLDDPWPKLFAVVSLVRRACIVPAHSLDEVARDSETRRILLQSLAALNRHKLFPQAWLTREALAEADMVRWLVFPTELGQAPDEIELMGRFPFASEEGPTEYFVFRFRTVEPHWAAKSGWMAGVAGPYLPVAEIEPSGAYGCFSHFNAWDLMTAEEHARTIVCAA
jgi:hypothetical protein